ncbi:STAS domain-containing protein [Streptomyces xanthophaeus]|uniref:STAS domain-containing protein n=1 Tax=Streptomyces xanthophaeus TaxID=67385 RepID=UPI00099B7973|nr:STAS domain-containing protein [Streptomyces xanthophaeus]
MIPAPEPLRLTSTETAGAARIELHGNFDHQDAHRLLDTVTEVLAGPGRLRHLHVDCTGMADVDSSGLSALLMTRRRADAAGVRLHLEGRPPVLERMLQVTGTLSYLTSPHAGLARREYTCPYRPSGPAAPPRTPHARSASNWTPHARSASTRTPHARSATSPRSSTSSTRTRAKRLQHHRSPPRSCA